MVRLEAGGYNPASASSYLGKMSLADIQGRQVLGGPIKIVSVFYGDGRSAAHYP